MNRPALIAFDVDGTLIDDTIFVWKTLHDHFRTDSTARERAKDDFFAGRISYQRWFEHDIELLLAKGANRGTMLEAIAKMRPMDGAHETLAEFVDAGVTLAVISGSISFVLDHVFPEHPFSDVLINHIGFDKTGDIVEWRHTEYDMAHKADGLRMLSEKHGVPLDRCAFVGDHFNDVEAVRIAGLGVAFNCKSEELARAADVVVDSNDLRDLLPHLLHRSP